MCLQSWVPSGPQSLPVPEINSVPYQASHWAVGGRVTTKHSPWTDNHFGGKPKVVVASTSAWISISQAGPSPSEDQDALGEFPPLDPCSRLIKQPRARLSGGELRGPLTEPVLIKHVLGSRNISSLFSSSRLPCKLGRTLPFDRGEAGPERENDLPKVTQPGSMEVMI